MLLEVQSQGPQVSGNSSKRLGRKDLDIIVSTTTADSAHVQGPRNLPKDIGLKCCANGMFEGALDQ